MDAIAAKKTPASRDCSIELPFWSHLSQREHPRSAHGAHKPCPRQAPNVREGLGQDRPNAVPGVGHAVGNAHRLIGPCRRNPGHGQARLGVSHQGCVFIHLFDAIWRFLLLPRWRARQLLSGRTWHGWLCLAWLESSITPPASPESSVLSSFLSS